MPGQGPVIKDPRPDWLRDPSVMDPPPIRGLRTIIDFFGGNDPDQIMDIAPLGMAAGKLKGFTLPGGKTITRDVEGVMRLSEGDEAVKALRKATGDTTSRRMTRHMSDAVTSPEDLSTITNIKPLDPTYKPSIRKIQSGADSTAGRRGSAKLNESIVKGIKDRFNEGAPIEALKEEYPEIHKKTLKDIIDGMAWNWVK